MSDPAIVSAVISGTVSSVAIVGAVITTLMTLRHQRKLEGERQGHERSLRLLDSMLTTAIDFLAAADRTTRAQQSLSTAYISLDGSKSSKDEKTYQQFLAIVEESRASALAAAADAENAYSAIRMLVPGAVYPGRKFLDLCKAANAYPDDTKVDRERARQMTEQAIHSALGHAQSDAAALVEVSRPSRRLALRRGRRQVMERPAIRKTA